MRASMTLATKIGSLTVTELDGAIAAIDWGAHAVAPAKTPLLTEAARQIRAYLAGRLKSFDLPLAIAGSPFQRRVFATMREICYGAVMSYGDLARAVDSAPRAIGTACGANPLPILVPWHRVVALGGTLGGFRGCAGLETRQSLCGVACF